MADAYRGLTVQFGGDTTKLTQALKTANRAATETQKQLKAVETATKIDPSSVALVSTKLSLVKDRAQEAGARLGTLREAAKQLGAEEFGSAKVEALAEKTENAALQASLASDRYAALVKELAALYNPINEAAQKSKEFSTVWEEFSDKKFSMSELFTFNDADFNLVIADMKQLGLITDEEVERAQALRQEFREVSDANDAARAVSQFKQLGNEIQAVETDAKGLSQQMAQIKAPSSISQGLSSARSELESLDKASEAVARDLKACDDALQLNPKNVEASAQRTRDLAEATELAQKKAENLGAQIDAYKTAGIDKLAEVTENAGKSADEAKQAWAEANAKLQIAKGTLQEMQNEHAKLNDKVRAGVELTDKEESAFKQLESGIEQASAEVERLERAEQAASKAMDTAQAVQELEQLETSAREAQNELDRLNSDEVSVNVRDVLNGVGQIGSELSNVLTPLMEQVGECAIESAQTIDSAYRDMRKTVNGTEEDFEALKEAAVEFSQTHVTSADQILEIQAIGGELGVATDALDTFAEVVSNIDVATDLDTDEAADALGTLSNVMQMSESDMEGFADALVRLGNNGASTESEIADIATRIGSMGTIVGMSKPDILAWSSALASTGQSAESAGTALSNTLSDIETVVAAFTENGSDDIEGFAEVAQMGAQEFADAWNSDPTVALEAFVKGLNSIEDGGGSADATLEGLGITATRQKQAIMGLMQTIDGLDDNLRMSEDAWNGVSDEWGDAGDAANEASKKAEGLSGSISRIQNAAQNMGAELGDAVAPIVSDFADILGDLSDWLANTDDGFKQAVVGAGVFLGTVGPVLVATERLGNGISLLTSGIGTLTTGIGTLTTGLTAGLVGVGIAAAVGAIATIVSAYDEWVQHNEDVEKATSGLQDAVKESVSSFETCEGTVWGLDEAYEETASDVDSLIQGLGELVDTINERTEATETEVASLANAQAVIDQYNGKTGLSIEQQARLKAAVDLVNDACGTEYSVIDAVNGVIADQNGVIQTNVDAIDELIAAKKSEIKAEMLAENLKDLYSQQISAQQEVKKATEEATQAQKEYDDLLADSANREWDLSYQAELGDAAAKAQEATQSLNDATLALESVNSAVRDTETEYGNAVTGINDEVKAQIATMSDEMQQYGLSIGQMLSTGITESGVDVTAAVDFLKVGVQESVGSMSPEMQGLGYEVAKQLAAGISTGSVDVQTATDLMRQLATADVSTWPELFSNAGLEIPSAISGGISELQSLPADQVQSMVDAMVLQMEGGDVTVAAQVLGHNIDEGLAQAIRDGDESVTAVYGLSEDVVNTARDALGVHSPSTVFAAIGSDVVAGLANGMSDTSSVTGAAEGLANAASDPLEGIASSAAEWGSHLASNFASGISSMWGAVSSAASSIATAARNIIGFSVPKKGPWSGAEQGGERSGRHLVENIASGMVQSIPEMEAAAERVAKAASIDADEQDGYARKVVAQAENYAKAKVEAAKSLNPQAIGSAVASAVASSLDGALVSMDGKAVGQLVAPTVDRQLGKSARKGF